MNMLLTLFQYQAWANSEFFNKMEAFHPERHKEELHAALRLMNHSYVVGQIFAGHLTGKPHGFQADNTPETPSLAELRSGVAALDSWYQAYVETVMPEALSENIAMVFTDGDKGSMSREEMLTHVVTHAGYHRGEVGRIMRQLGLELPWDTLAVYLHRSEPQRRQHGA